MKTRMKLRMKRTPNTGSEPVSGRKMKGRSWPKGGPEQRTEQRTVHEQRTYAEA
jgi:hypothetical protein